MNSYSYYQEQLDEGKRVNGPPADRLVQINERSRPPREPQQVRSREKRDRILLSAAKLFAAGGVDSATTTDIAREAGVSIGTLYSYFTDKRQILLALVADNAESVLGHASVRFEIGEDPLKGFRSLLESTIPYDPDRAYLRQCWAQLGREDREVGALGEEIHDELYRRLRAAAELWSRMSNFRRNIDIDSACWAVLQLFDALWHLPNRAGQPGRREFETRRDAVARVAYSAFFEGAYDAETNE